MIDSWAWIEYFKGSRIGRLAQPHIDGHDEALISAMTLAEVYHWFLKAYDEQQAHEARQTMERRCTLLPLTADLAVQAARLKAEKRLHFADAIAYASARAHEAILLTGDPDFKGLEHVEFIGA